MRKLFLLLLALLPFGARAQTPNSVFNTYPQPLLVGTLAQRPTFAFVGEYYYATNTMSLYIVTAAPNTWATVSGGAGSGCVPGGSLGQILQDTGSGSCSDSLATDNGTTFAYTGTGGYTGPKATFGTDNSAAGTLQLANGSANAHTIWSSGATTSNTIQGFAIAPTTGDLVDCVTTSTTCLLTDSGVLAANVVTDSGTATSNTMMKGAGSKAIQTSLLTDDGTTLAYSGSGGIKSSGSGGVGGTLTLPEGTAASASSGNDVCYGDSTAHSVKCSYNNGTFFGLPQRICSQVAISLRTSAISSATTDSAATGTCTGLTTNDTISCTFAADPTSSTGFTASTNGILTIFVYPTSNTINIKYQNNTAGTITPSAQTANCAVYR